MEVVFRQAARGRQVRRGLVAPRRAVCTVSVLVVNALSARLDVGGPRRQSVPDVLSSAVSPERSRTRVRPPQRAVRAVHHGLAPAGGGQGQRVSAGSRIRYWADGPGYRTPGCEVLHGGPGAPYRPDGVPHP
ncbi:hypothetical protein QJS66_04990 [Kocuria rhizophila]|nr:hypothetical protein QJS66_04990 [Kocuria rhizophila]